jgi:hypothetical protein
MAAISENYSGGTFLSDLVSRPEFLAYTSRGHLRAIEVDPERHRAAQRCS